MPESKDEDTTAVHDEMTPPGQDGIPLHGDAQETNLSKGLADKNPKLHLQLAMEDNTQALESTHLQNGNRILQADPAPLPTNDSLLVATEPYLDPTPKTPAISRRPSHQEQDAAEDEKTGTTIDDRQSDKAAGKLVEDDNESTAEIQSIMEQFQDEAAAPTREEIMSPRKEVQDPMQTAVIGGFPPRRSSLEPLRSRDMDAIATSPIATSSEKFDRFPTSPPPVPPKTGSESAQNSITSIRNISTSSISSQLPIPEPEPELPFDFHRFLEQLRHKSADPVARFLRSFLSEFGKKQWMVHEQVKLIGDFLAFITNKMAHCDVWKEVSDNEFDNAKEGMEKLVMNRLYSQTFSPAIPAPPSTSRNRGKRKELEKILGPGRKGQHQEDVERDDILAQKIRIYSWVREEHLEIPPVGPNGERFLRLAQQELLKIKSYRAPRDKVICVLNCCKVIFGLLKNAQSSDTSADSFVPLLIYVVLQANPEHLVSNIQYILRFRNQDKLAGEAGYYLSSLSGAIQFIENLDRTTLTVSDEEFEKNVEQAVSAIAAQNREKEVNSPTTQTFSEKSGLVESDITPRTSLEMPPVTPKRNNSKAGTSSSGTEVSTEEGVGSLLRTIQKPLNTLSTIGRMFSDPDGNTQQEPRSSSSSSGQRKQNASALQPPSTAAEDNGSQVQSLDAQEAAARQASAEAAEARRIQRAEHRTVVDTLQGMFPNLDRDVIDDVVTQKQGRVGLAVDACLTLTAGI